MRQQIVAGNWKMNKDYAEGLKLVSEAVHMIKDEVRDDVLSIFAPSFIHLHSVAQLIKDVPNVEAAAQDCFYEQSGAYTGEVSPLMIRSTGAKFVIIGHSERRTFFNDTDEVILKKVNAALECGLRPIFCCGETLAEREAGKQESVLFAQLSSVLFKLDDSEFSRVIIAYEPVWAIGTGRTATPDQAQEIHRFIRKSIADKFGKDAAERISILYGGSCNPANAMDLFSEEDIDGGLIGGASLKSRDFADIVKCFNVLKRKAYL